MDQYFITKKAVEIILENINDHFIKCLVSLSVQERYMDDMKIIIGVIELLKTYMDIRRNDILSSYIKYTNKSYYLQLTDSLFRIIQSHLIIAKQFNQNDRYVFISDLISKYNYPAISSITHNYNDYNVETTDTTPLSKDAGTLFKDAYYRLKTTKAKDIELQMKTNSDLL